MSAKEKSSTGSVPRLDDLVDENLWDRLRVFSLQLPAGSPGRLIATEVRPTVREFLARLPLYDKLLATEVD